MKSFTQYTQYIQHPEASFSTSFIQCGECARYNVMRERERTTDSEIKTWIAKVQ